MIKVTHTGARVYTFVANGPYEIGYVIWANAGHGPFKLRISEVLEHHDCWEISGYPVDDWR